MTELFVTAPARSRYGDLAERAAAQGAPVHEVSGEVMTELAQTVTPQGLLAVCRFVDVSAGRADRGRAPARRRARERPGPWQRRDRAADGGRRRSPGRHLRRRVGRPVQQQMRPLLGRHLFHLAVVQGVPLSDAAAALRGAGLQVLAADGSAGRQLGEFESAGLLARPTAWLFGNEAWGLPADLLALADDAVAVPIYGRAESLNLAAAAAVCLYASAQAQNGPLTGG